MIKNYKKKISFFNFKFFFFFSLLAVLGLFYFIQTYDLRNYKWVTDGIVKDRILCLENDFAKDCIKKQIWNCHPASFGRFHCHSIKEYQEYGNIPQSLWKECLGQDINSIESETKCFVTKNGVKEECNEPMEQFSGGDCWSVHFH